MEQGMFDTFEFLKGMGKGKGKMFDPNVLVNQLAINILKQLQGEIGRAITVLEKPGYDPFTILGVSPLATKDEVTRAYKEKAKEFHPDRGGDNQKMAELNIARDIIFKFREWHK